MSSSSPSLQNLAQQAAVSSRRRASCFHHLGLLASFPLMFMVSHCTDPLQVRVAADPLRGTAAPSHVRTPVQLLIPQVRPLTQSTHIPRWQLASSVRWPR